MKKLQLIATLLIIEFGLANCQSVKDDVQGPYLGQKQPGLQPEFFAPGIISHPDYFEHSAAVFSPDGEEVYWAGEKNGNRYAEIYFMKQIKGKWSERQIAPFCKKKYK